MVKLFKNYIQPIFTRNYWKFVVSKDHLLVFIARMIFVGVICTVAIVNGYKDQFWFEWAIAGSIAFLLINLTQMVDEYNNTNDSLDSTGSDL